MEGCSLRCRSNSLPLFSRSLFLASLGAQAPLRVAAAADLEPVLPPILVQFEKTTGIHAEATYQSSATLTAQIENGAPFDVFLSADLGFPKRLIDAGFADSTAPDHVCARARSSSGSGKILICLRRRSIFFVDPRLRRLAIANPERAPYGRAAVAALKSLRLYDTLKPRIVTAENIAQAAQFVDSANADAGLISLTSALTPRLSADGSYFIIPQQSLPAYRAGRRHRQQNQRSAARHNKLLDFLLSPAVQAEFAKSGLTPVK